MNRSLRQCAARRRAGRRYDGAMIHALAITGTVVWFGLNGLLWYARPGDLPWLLGSGGLGVVFFAAFFGYLDVLDRKHRP